MTAIPPTLPTTAPATTGGDVLLSSGLLVPFRAPFGMPVATLLNVPTAPPPATTTDVVGAAATELGLENAVDDGKEDELKGSNEDDDRSRPELDDGIEDEDEDDEREDLEDVPAAATVALFPVIALIIAGKGTELEALMLAKVH